MFSKTEKQKKHVFRENVMGVMSGGVLGHAICTGCAVLGGKFISHHVTVRSGEVLHDCFCEQNCFHIVIYLDFVLSFIITV